MTTLSHPPNSRLVSRRSLWFGFAAAVPAWVLAGTIDVLLAWQICMGRDLAVRAGSSGDGMRVLLAIVTFGLLAVAVAGAIVSFGNWKKLSENDEFLSAEGRNRKQYMALSGVLVSTVLAVGIVWFSIPVFIVSLCSRVR
jgi:hypothetical protein